ncbi:hypothetical protein PPYR_04524 [Photinus pyralis]|uniref:Miro domain-containing protein n=2 Tax=Photinus pyralis TaxID=7054 RepID=A0A5N4AYB4_PHOPY|nr:GTP-binding protein RHO1-like isoform X2 [Photinus pyralis]XP_031334234.1 GTP-binding protein RHO1-like isoform X2 [Photinus pyralis]XP_031348917.1 GTP-binding protein RHO1-like isoform X2 [Photinus pyralis]KAB0802337.1 hypothetical protein PPYR_04523 [Photinus pyralis]KAB0802338.1 hypothetical protein PPYR_04524 [Photinus pyralis]
MTFKIVIIGDRNVGKSSLLRRYAKGEFKDYNPNSFPPIVPEYMYESTVTNDKTSEVAVLIDTVADEDYDDLRPITYNLAKVILVCYSVDDELSFFHVVRKWVPEITKHQSRIPFILVGTKSDLVAKISTNEGKQLAEKLHAAAFLECSSKDGTGIKEVFTTALNIYTRSFAYKRRNKRPCNIM